MITPIETEYNGCKYRSRLEARWAVFFDSLNISFEYEKEGFDIDGERYLPDFWIKDWNCWLEIKPIIMKKYILGNDEQDRNNIERAFRLCRKLSDNINNVVLLIGGDPWVDGTESLNNLNEEDRFSFYYEIIVFYPKSIMESCNFNEALKKTNFSLEMETKGIHNRLTQEFYTSSETNSLYWYLQKEYQDNPHYFNNPLPELGNTKALIEADKIHYKKKHDKEDIHWKYYLCEGQYAFKLIENKLYLSNIIDAREYQEKKLLNAYIEAKKARFEHF
jgi:hypothetical protein